MRTIYKIIPYEKLKLETSLPKDELLKRLANNIEPGRASRNWFTGKSSSSKYFEGSLHENGFNIHRIIGYRNSFLPEISGEFDYLRFGITLNLKLKLNPIALLIGAIWFAGVIATCIITIASNFRASNDDFVFAPLLMFGFGSLLFVLGFKFESIKARKYLKQLLEASEAQDFLSERCKYGACVVYVDFNNLMQVDYGLYFVWTNEAGSMKK